MQLATSEIWLTPSPFETASALRDGRLLLTPNPRASRSLGTPPMSLLRTAQRILAREPECQIDALDAAQLLVEVARGLGYPDPPGAARRFAPVMAEVLRAGLDLDSLAAFADPRAQEVARFTGAYVARLRERRLYDPAEILWLAASRIRKQEPILLYGYQHLGRDEEHFVLALAAPGSAIALPRPNDAASSDNLDTARRFEAAGWTIRRPENAQGERPRHLQGWQFPEQEAEVRGVLAHVKALLSDGTSPADIALVARDDAAYGPLVVAVAQEQGVPVNAEYQVPLSRTRFGHWLNLLTEVVEGDLPFEATFRLLSHPLCRLLNAETRTLARQTHPSDPVSWANLCPQTSELAWPEHAEPREWAERLRTLIQSFGLARRVRPWASEVIALGRFERALEAIATRPHARLSRADFISDLREALAILTTPAHPARGGVSLHTPLALFGARVKHVFVLGSAEDQLPARLNDDPVLDFATRKRLVAAGFPLETAAAAARREHQTFTAILGIAAETLTLAYPRMAGGKPRLPSPAYGWLGIEPVEPEVPVASLEEGRRIKIFGEDAEPDPVLARARQALMVERRREAPGLLSEQDPHDGYTGVPVAWRNRTFSSTQLSTLGQCAFKWYAQRVLRIQEPDEASDAIAPDVRGKLYHKTLDLACRRAAGSPDIRQAVLDGLEAAFLAAEEALVDEIGYHLPDVHGWEAIREEHLNLLGRAVQHEAFIDPGAVVVATERDFRGVWREFTIRGQIDRIDQLEDALQIIDYKAGSSIYGKAQDSQRKATLDLQLPIYAEAAAPELFPDVPVGDAFYYTLSKPKRHGAKVDADELDTLIARLKAHLEEGHFPVAPDLKRKACTYCDQLIVCRAGARLARKEA